jgi:hypothetical protein
MKRIFLLSSERSGSNLVRRILNRSAEISGPPPPHLLHSFGQWWPMIDLNSDNREKISKHAISLLYDNLSPWEHEVKADQLRVHLDEHGWDFERVCDYCYSEFARCENKQGYMVKDNFAFKYAFQTALRFPDAKFIYLVRDPRDFALSYKKAPGGPKVAWVASKQWVSEQKACLQFHQAMPERCHIVRYEDLVENSEPTVQNLFGFLGIVYNPEVLRPDKAANSEASASQYWENLSKPILSGNTKKYLQELGKTEIQSIENVCHPIMRLHGYTPENSNFTAYPGLVGKLWLTGLDQVARRLVYRRRMVDSAELEIRKKRAATYRQIERLTH